MRHAALLREDRARSTEPTEEDLDAAKYGNRVAIAWTVLGLVLMLWVPLTRPERLSDLDRVYVEEETIAPVAPAAEPA